MGFLASLFDPSKGAGFQAQGVDQLQATNAGQLADAYRQSQSGISQQQNLANLLSNTGGIQNQQSVFAQQQALANQLGQQVQGNGPNPALAQLANTTGQNVAQTSALMGSQRGANANVGLLGRQAAQQGAGVQQQAAGQAAVLKAQQQLAAQQQLQQQQGMMAQLSGQQIGQQTGAIGNLAQLGLAQQGQQQQAAAQQNATAAQMQGNINNANASIAAQNAKSQQGIIGGLFGGLSGALGLSDGGEVPQTPFGRFFSGFNEGMGNEEQQPSSNPVQTGFGMLGQGLGNAIGKGIGNFAVNNLPFSPGGRVDGQAQVEGDSYANDTVPAMLSPGEIVLPRSVTRSDNPIEKSKKFVKKTLHLADGTPDQPIQDDQLDMSQSAPSNAPPTASIPIAPNPQALNAMMGAQFAGPGAGDNSIPQNYPVNFGESQQSQDQGVPKNLGAGEYQNTVENIANAKMEEAQQTGALGAEQAKASAQLATNLDKNQKDTATVEGMALQHMNDAMTAYRNGEINPNHYLENMGAGRKISTAIGLIMGGIGGALTGTENPAMKFLNDQINRDVQAQMANSGRQENLFSMGMKMFGNVQDAANYAKSTEMAIHAAQIEAAGQKAVGPIEKQRAIQAAQAMKQQALPVYFDLFNKQRILGQAQTQGNTGAQAAIHARFLSPDEHTRTAALGEIKQQQNINAGNQNALSAFDKVAQLQTLVNRTFNPVQSQKQIDAAWDPMIDKLTKTNEGRVTPITIDLMSALKPKMTDDAETLAEKRQNLYSLLNAERSTPTLDSIGVQLPKVAGAACPNASVMNVARYKRTR